MKVLSIQIYIVVLDIVLNIVENIIAWCYNYKEYYTPHKKIGISKLGEAASNLCSKLKYESRKTVKWFDENISAASREPDKCRAENV